MSVDLTPEQIKMLIDYGPCPICGGIATEWRKIEDDGGAAWGVTCWHGDTPDDIEVIRPVTS